MHFLKIAEKRNSRLSMTPVTYFEIMKLIHMHILYYDSNYRLLTLLTALHSLKKISWLKYVEIRPFNSSFTLSFFAIAIYPHFKPKLTNEYRGNNCNLKFCFVNFWYISAFYPKFPKLWHHRMWHHMLAWRSCWRWREGFKTINF
jgi:hypothetical protein